MAKEMITGAEALMRALKNDNVTTIFGYPGGAIMPVFDALYDYTRGEKKAFEHVWCVMNSRLPMLLKVMHVPAAVLEFVS